jgi:hypothetical protein
VLARAPVHLLANLRLRERLGYPPILVFLSWRMLLLGLESGIAGLPENKGP